MRSISHGVSPLAVRARLLVALALVAIGSVWHVQPSWADTAEGAIDADSGTGHLQGPFTGNVNINELLGADRFYNAGYTGTAAVMASIEAGFMWSGHETLTHVQQIPTSGITGEIDRHATWVGLLMGGRNGGMDPGPYRLGIAPDAELHSGAIATSWPNSAQFPRYTGSFNANFFSTTTYGPFRRAIETGITGVGGTRTADVLNVSFNSTAASGILGGDQMSGVLDALVFENPHTFVAVAVGNTLPSGAGPNKVLSPATAYNNIAVAALGPASTGYNQVAAFSHGGPNNYNDPSTGTVLEARQVVDIAAPGEQLSSAYYGGETGGNGPGVFGPPDGPAGGPDYYSRSIRGTSFASPLVAAGGALLHDAAYDVFSANPDAHDSRVIKAVLMNSADKTQGWNNGQISHPNGFGGIRTTQGLDNRVGTGRMNLDAAFDQYLLGTTDVAGTSQGFLGEVDSLGWDFGEVAQGTTNDYRLSESLHEGSQITATLTWFRDRTQVGAVSFTDNSYDNLDLEFWLVENDLPSQLISESVSLYNSSEHFSFLAPQAGDYMLRVRWTAELFDNIADANSSQYGLAWIVIVPEPATLALLLLGWASFAGFLARRRRARPGRLG